MFFKSAAFWKLGRGDSIMDSDVIPCACDDFGELIYEKAISSHDDENQVVLTMIKMLERLRACQTASEANTKEFWKIYSQKNLNLVLSRLYKLCGRKADAEVLLKEKAQRGIDLLQDDLSWNDEFGFQTLSKVFIAYGREDDARIALGLRQVTDSEICSFLNDASDDASSECGEDTAGVSTPEGNAEGLSQVSQLQARD
jgi:hypothetical protein